MTFDTANNITANKNGGINYIHICLFFALETHFYSVLGNNYGAHGNQPTFTTAKKFIIFASSRWTQSSTAILL